MSVSYKQFVSVSNIYIYIYIFNLFLGVGDFQVKEISMLPDPCPLPDKEKKRSLNEKERLLYAPMCGVGGVVYDKVRSFWCVFVFDVHRINTQAGATETDRPFSYNEIIYLYHEVFSNKATSQHNNSDVDFEVDTC